MAQIHKFSLAFDAEQDRLAWDTEDVEGVTTRLWLTQRFCRGMVGALLPILEKSTGADVPSQHSATFQSWEQAAAMSKFGHTPPVRPQSGTTVGLVRAVHITPSSEGISLTFDFGANESRSVGLTHVAVRQMLAAMHRLYVAAGWPVEIWPTWIVEPAAAATAPSDTVN